MPCWEDRVRVPTRPSVYSANAVLAVAGAGAAVPGVVAGAPTGAGRRGRGGGGELGQLAGGQHTPGHPFGQRGEHQGGDVTQVQVGGQPRREASPRREFLLGMNKETLMTTTRPVQKNRPNPSALDLLAKPITMAI